MYYFCSMSRHEFSVAHLYVSCLNVLCTEYNIKLHLILSTSTVNINNITNLNITTMNYEFEYYDHCDN